MQYIPVKTRIMQPPQDDLFELLSESLAEVKEGDVVLITSKIVSIHQGRCVPTSTVSKRELVEQESEYIIDFPDSQTQSPLAIVHHALFMLQGLMSLTLMDITFYYQKSHLTSQKKFGNSLQKLSISKI